MIGLPRPGIDQHVARLDIPVHQLSGMRRVQRRGYRRDDRCGSRRRQRAAPAHQCSGVTARHVPHGQEQHPIRFPRIKHRDDVRMIHCGRGPGFPDEPAPE